ncbi:MAG: hypothetical protein ABII00_16535 [Elusimicrobiota bacterium]
MKAIRWILGALLLACAGPGFTAEPSALRGLLDAAGVESLPDAGIPQSVSRDQAGSADTAAIVKDMTSPHQLSRRRSRPAFTDLMDLVIDPSCGAYGGDVDADVRRAVASLFLNSVEEGLDRLEAWAPGLVAEIQSNVAGKRLIVYCGGCGEGVGKFVTDTLSRNILYYSPAEGGLAGIMIRSAGRSAQGPQCRRAPGMPGRVHSDPHLAWGANKNALFHEFLHFAGVDNVDQDTHNRLDSWSAGRQADRVFSCAALAHPTPVAPVAKWSMRGWYASTVRSCSTCVDPDSPLVPKCRRSFPEGPAPNLDRS